MADADPQDYFRFVRRDIEPLLPAKATRILEVGCGAGRTLAWLKSKWPNAATTGVDGCEDIRDELAGRVDTALIHDLDTPLPDLGGFDLILALDVLEHLRHPDQALRNLAAKLDPDGVIIVSVPNVANYEVLLPLLLKRRFRYDDAGILDRTHLRFFTEESALGLMRGAGLKVTDGVATGFWSRRSSLIDKATFGLVRHYLAIQYVMRGQRQGNESFSWRTY